MQKKVTNRLPSLLAIVAIVAILFVSMIPSAFATEDIKKILGDEKVGINVENLDALISGASGNEVKFELKGNYGKATNSVKYVFSSDTMLSKGTGKTYVMPFGDVTLSIPGKIFKDMKDVNTGDNFEVTVEKKQPFSKELDDKGNVVSQSDAVTYATAVILGYKDEKSGTEKPPHPMVGKYVYVLKVNYGSKGAYKFADDITITYNADKDAIKATPPNHVFNVYAVNENEQTYGPVKGTSFNKSTGETKFKMNYTGWFYLAADEPIYAPNATMKYIITWAVIGVVAIAIIVIGIILMKKKFGDKKPEEKKADAE